MKPGLFEREHGFYLFLRFDLLLANLMLISWTSRYIEGTKIRVRKVAKLRPRMIDQASGPQNAALSPPI